MSNSIQFKTFARPVPKALVNYCSAGGVSVGVPTAVATGMSKILSGALTANTLSTALSVTGSGSLNFICVAAEDTTSRTVRIKITLDGTAVFDSTSNAFTASSYGVIAVGVYTSSMIAIDDIPFNSSCLIQIASSLSETDKISLRGIWRTN